VDPLDRLDPWGWFFWTVLCTIIPRKNSWGVNLPTRARRSYSVVPISGIVSLD
jgi:hypothetical protein